MENHQNDGIPTAERLAQQHGVSKATIERDGKFAEAVEAWAAYEKAKAKERQEQNVGRPKTGEEKSVETFPQIKSRDAIGARVGVSGRTYEKFGVHLTYLAIVAIPKCHIEHVHYFIRSRVVVPYHSWRCQATRLAALNSQ